jgi:FkbM family methyltransferase
LLNKAFIKEVGKSRWLFKTIVRQFYKRVLKREHTMRLPGGGYLILPVNNRFASEAFITGSDVDWGSEELLYSQLKGKGFFLDIGAHIGYYSLYMLPKTKGVHAFEPDPRVLKFLEKNLGRKTNVHINTCAVGNKKGKAKFILENDAEVSHLARNEQPNTNEIEIDVTTIDSFVCSHNLSIEAIKIDVEGFDLDVISGGMETMLSQQPIVLTESTPDTRLFELAGGVSYRVFAFVCNAKTRSKRFVELKKQPLENEHTKMLFLVPPNLSAEIEKKTA